MNKQTMDRCKQRRLLSSTISNNDHFISSYQDNIKRSFKVKNRNINVNNNNNKNKNNNKTDSINNNNNSINNYNSKNSSNQLKQRSLLCFLTFLFISSLCIGCVGSTETWWNIGLFNFSRPADYYSSQHLTPSPNFELNPLTHNQISCEKFPGFSSQQRRMCFIYLDHMAALGRGAQLALRECQHQFRNHRWNCTVGNDSHIFSHFTSLGSPEIGYVHSIMSAFIASSLARSCKDGELTTCECSKKERPRSLPRDWLWEGCGDDIYYGRLFTDKFIKAHYDTNPLKDSKDYLSQVTERHNGEVGSKAAVMLSKPVCKCHGVSGSCNVKTCWEEVASTRDLGNYLKTKYEEAIPVRPSKRVNVLRRKHRSVKKLTKSDIVYFSQPPDYCEFNLKKGSFGTKGRFCNKTSSGHDGCEHMCCGRGYYTKKVTIHEQCHCKFRWCCEVKCKICESVIDVYWCR